VKALKLPRLALQTLFGKVQHDSRSFEEVCRIYQDEIKKGARASGQFLPNETTIGNNEQAKTAQLQKASDVIDDLIEACKKWEEDALDQYQLPHPIIGNLTVREILFFTIHHNLRHASHEGD
jgi:uncharacterized damage-inducible protein DinB